MALITKQVKISNKVENRLADIFNVDMVLFKRVKFNSPFVFRFTFFVFERGDLIGTINYFWDIRKTGQVIMCRRFEDGEVITVRHLNDRRIGSFYEQ